MRISYERTGGFAAPAMRRACTVDSASLPEDQARELHRLVEAADLFNLPPQASAPAAARDAFRYRLGIEAEGRQHAIEVFERDVPEGLRPLLKWLNNRCSAGTQR